MSEPTGTPVSVVGSRLKRKEDHRLVTGRGRYLDDIRLPGVLHAALVRSPHAHARIDRIDGTAALAIPGEAPGTTPWLLLRRLARAGLRGVRPGPASASFPWRMPAAGSGADS